MRSGRGTFLTGFGDPHVQWGPHSAFLACSLEKQQSAIIYIVIGVGFFFYKQIPQVRAKNIEVALLRVKRKGENRFSSGARKWEPDLFVIVHNCCMLRVCRESHQGRRIGPSIWSSE